ncbi:hypothetical protein [Acetobacterium woodii]|uniref:Transmembrane protein n=1 Tax=Acetobacterium woodii (strain ATCC 29683 / DSM 1030 / JCM 2381 / KCTC 1655 / WB1) TaxID=931626 RepID=H6LCE5_ACEWD|nr:hypothetical protein [Acetobacterium woodii]AFA50260.1 hypothetical protein Awo_c35360 [Acetobacterium woodii DSM 1030]
MAVKARETLESKQISMFTLVLLMVVVVGYTVLYNQFANTLEDYRLKTIVGVISLVIMMGGFLISLRYITTVYEMLITHEIFTIERKIFFWKKTVFEIKIKDIIKILPAEEAKKVEGQMYNFTLTNMDGKRKYVIQYERQGKICGAKIQCTGKFYESLKKQVKI